MQTVDIYSKGLCACSVCAPAGMPREEVEAAVNAQSPTGIESRWTVADDEFFKDGTTPNGGIVDCKNGHTRHWLLNC